MPVSDCEVRDPRIRRTRQLLQEALRTLMQSKSFDEISVQDITETATVNRATFYDHYADKYALLEAMIASGFHRLLDERKVCYDGTCPSAATALILAACHYLTLTHSGEYCRTNPFEPLIESAIVAAIQRTFLKGMPPTAPGSGIPMEMVASAVSWAIYGAVKQWFYAPNHPPAEEIAPSILQLILPMLSSSGEPREVAAH